MTEVNKPIYLFLGSCTTLMVAWHNRFGCVVQPLKLEQPVGQPYFCAH